MGYLGNEDSQENMEKLKKYILESIKDNLIRNKNPKNNTLVMIPSNVSIKSSINLLTDLNENVSIKGKIPLYIIMTIDL